MALPQAQTLPAPSPTLRSFDDLPGPRPWPLLGNALQVRVDQIHLDVEQWAREYGPLFRFSLGPMKIMVVADHTQVATMLRDRPNGFRRPTIVTEVFTEMGFKSGVFTAEGDDWQRQRRMVMASFSPTHVKTYHPTLLTVAQRLKQRWQRAAQSGDTLALLPELMRYTVDGVAGLAFGVDVNTLESNDHIIQEHLDKVFPAWFKRINAVVPYWRFVKMPADRSLDRSVTVINQAIDGFIGQARRRLAQDPSLRAAPTNLLEAMIVAADEEGSGLDDDHIAGNVITMLLAGEDTTAITIAWMIYFLYSNPPTLQRARAEAVRCVSMADGVMTPECLAEMHYIDACANEAMRLKPVAPMAPLETLKDTVIADVAVPAGTMVWAMLRHDTMDASRFPDPQAFNPERWLDEGDHAAANTGVKRVSTPFGAGPRVCPGRYLAMLEIKMAIAMLLTNFDIEKVSTPDGQQPKELMAFAMSPVGLSMKLRQRA